MGLCIAVLAVNHNKKSNKTSTENCGQMKKQELQTELAEKKRKKAGNYDTEDMILGMCIWIVFGTALDWDLGLCISLGMLAGLAGGMSVKKDKNHK